MCVCVTFLLYEAPQAQQKPSLLYPEQYPKNCELFFPLAPSNYVRFWFLLDITLILNQKHKRCSKLHPSAFRWASQLINTFHNAR